jgi:hypothetical protein
MIKALRIESSCLFWLIFPVEMKDNYNQYCLCCQRFSAELPRIPAKNQSKKTKDKRKKREKRQNRRILCKIRINSPFVTFAFRLLPFAWFFLSTAANCPGFKAFLTATGRFHILSP